ncbi:polysaccharide biosynthesis protein [Allosphingosinicella deserti]|uniref:Polysaccharide biosynthesis protein CapD-like domain-containing protein n=1 Tax=Allosphingosinicella deserti TaxID=2116704 RepID=A0A2P7QEJ0_9SPHN|nr:polysaccharide biosynthesis protein [Sphingomonas deserti]PSJ36387.1 hypothetical protein C7I55_26455 [Sphingomonas deserti]
MATKSDANPADPAAPRVVEEARTAGARHRIAGSGFLPQSGAGMARLLAVVGLDAAAVMLTLPIAVARGAAPMPRAVPTSLLAMAAFAAVAVTVFFALRLYQRSWRYLSFEDCAFLGATVISGVSAAWAIRLYSSPSTFSDATTLLPSILLHFALVTGAMGAMRICRRALRERLRNRVVRKIEVKDRRRVLLIGELDWARAIIELARADPSCTFEICGILTDTPHVGRLQIAGVRVLGPPERLRLVVAALTAEARRPEAIIVHEDSEKSHDTLARLLPAADDLELTIGRIRHLWGEAGGDGSHLQLEQLPLAELLGRPMVELDKSPVARTIAGQRVLVTGAGGTIGSELVRQIAGFGPAEIVLLDHAEYNLYRVDLEVRERFPDVTFHSELCSIRQMPALRQIFDRHRPQLVFHAAALKHVPIVEASPCDGVHTNVLGTRNVANAVCEFGARAMVQVSTDKAVNPVGMMGATKRLGELYCQALDLIGASDTESPRFMTVRFGNVLGSSGSLIPLFKKQIAEGKPLTVTHPDMERFFMTVEEAVQLVLQSSTRTMELQGSRGAIFVLDMGAPVKIMDVAKRMLRLAGRAVTEDSIRVVGLRPGEKLFEELFDISEERVQSQIPGVFEARPCPLPLDRLVSGFLQLEQLIGEGDADALRALTLKLIEAPKGAAWDPMLLRLIQESSQIRPRPDPLSRRLTGEPRLQPAVPLTYSQGNETMIQICALQKSGSAPAGAAEKGPTAITKVRTAWPRHEAEEIDAVTDILASGRVNALVHGDETRAFEDEFAAYCGASAGIAVANGTLALELGLRALGIGPGDEVIVPARSFFATAACVVAVGASPVFADVDPVSQTIDPVSAARAVTSRTRALICVHLGGWPCAMRELQALSNSRGLRLIEDCAQAHGASYHGRRVGSFGDVAAFSFCTDKIMSTGGEGGMLLVNDERVYERAWAYKDHGKSLAKIRTAASPGCFRYVHDSFGSNFRMTEMQSAIGRIQLRNLPRWLAQRRVNAASLIAGLRAVRGLRLPIVPDGIEHAFYKFNFLLDDPGGARLHSGFIQELIDRGVPASAGTCPDMSREEAFTARSFVNPVELPGADYLGARNVTLPVDHTLGEAEMTFMAEAIRASLLPVARAVELIR